MITVGSYVVCKNFLPEFSSLICKVVSTNGAFIEIDICEGSGYCFRSSLLPYLVTEPTKYQLSGWVITNKSEHDLPPVPELPSWGDLDGVYVKPLDKKLYLWLQNLGDTFNHHCLIYSPFLSEKFPGKISVTLNRKDYDRDRQTALNPGRAIRLLFPEFSDAQVEKAVDDFRKKFSPKRYFLREGKEAKDFRHAYSHTQAPMENPQTTTARKSLSNSCMRYKAENFESSADTDRHPAEAYASGDFKIVWVADQHGRIAGRCTVYVNHTSGEDQPGPFYGVCEKSLDMLAEQFSTSYHRSDWQGAKLLRIPLGYRFLGPYLDVGNQTLRDDGDFLVVCNRGDLDASEYQGYIGQGGETCGECGGCVHEWDAHYHDDNVFCEECFEDLYTYCNIYEEYYPVDDTTMYNHIGSWGVKQNVCSTDAAAEYCTECSETGELWLTEDTSYNTYHGEPVCQPELDDNWFECELTDVYYTNHMLKHLVDKDGVSLEVGEVPEGYKLNALDGKYYQEEEV